MERITAKMLNMKVDYLNQITGNCSRPYSEDEDGIFKANIGTYHISGAYGGVCLHQMMNEGGGVNCPINHGHTPKRELYNQLCSFIDGILTERGER